MEALVTRKAPSPITRSINQMACQANVVYELVERRDAAAIDIRIESGGVEQHAFAKVRRTGTGDVDVKEVTDVCRRLWLAS